MRLASATVRQLNVTAKAGSTGEPNALSVADSGWRGSKAP
jgi:hypothetical protein